MNFANTLEKLRMRARKSRYRLAKYSGLNQAYLLRLERGQRGNPSRDVVIMLGLALVEGSDSVSKTTLQHDPTFNERAHSVHIVVAHYRTC